MLSGWRYVSLGVVGSSSDTLHRSLTQSLLAGAVLGLYFGGTGLVKLWGGDVIVAIRKRVHLNLEEC